MNLFNRCLTAFSLFFIAHLCLAQNTVSGIVLDDEGLPLYGATVIIGDSNEGTVTNPQGAFELKTEKEFPLEIEVSFVGFDSKTFTFNSNNLQNFKFEVAAINLLNNRFRALPGFPRLGRTVTGRLVLNLK